MYRKRIVLDRENVPGWRGDGGVPESGHPFDHDVSAGLLEKLPRG